MAAMPDKTVTLPEPTSAATDPGRPESDQLDTGLVEDDLVVEEISIDGMCGVY